MKLVRTLSLGLAIAAAGAFAWAAEDVHHAAGAASGTASKAMPARSSSDMTRMDAQMRAMREMHERMMAAKTPDERNALMAEHMQAMQEGMAMMNGMAPAGMSGMKGGMNGDTAAQHQMMEKRMDMMQAAMQMMMDRLPAAPAK
jgi:hypothetical protein